MRLGIRPEHFQIVDESEAALKVVAELVEHLDADTLVHGRIGGDRLTIRLQGVRHVNAGDRLPVEASALHLFDADSGARIDV